MIESIEKLSDKARAAYQWAFYASLRDEQQQINSTHFLTGIQCATPELFSGVDLRLLGFTPLDVNDTEKIKAEVQKLSIKAQLAQAKEKPPDGAMGFAMPFAPVTRPILDLAVECAESLNARTVGTPHLLMGLFKADEELRGKLERANLGEDRILSYCRNYKAQDEGQTMAEELQQIRGRSFRSGLGYDLHRLETGRPLMIGGVEVPFDKGPVGHSDGDVLAHAICDALLGAAGLGDIGTHFPDTDPKWKGANSLLFLEHAKKLLEEKGLAIEHVDAVVILERPKLGPHFPKMREALAKALGVAAEKIHLKAKTNEGVDAVGRGEAIAAHVVATLVLK